MMWYFFETSETSVFAIWLFENISLNLQRVTLRKEYFEVIFFPVAYALAYILRKLKTIFSEKISQILFLYFGGLSFIRHLSFFDKSSNGSIFQRN
jgi:hypothetical protein